MRRNSTLLKRFVGRKSKYRYIWTLLTVLFDVTTNIPITSLLEGVQCLKKFLQNMIK